MAPAARPTAARLQAAALLPPVRVLTLTRVRAASNNVFRLAFVRVCKPVNQTKTKDLAMKKIMIVVAVLAMSVAACGKKKDAAAPTPPAADPAAPAGDGSAAPAGDGSAAPEAAPAM